MISLRNIPVVAFVGRFVPGVRTLISVPCGMAKMNIWKFSIYTFVAMFPLTTLYVYFGMKLGALGKAADVVGQYMLPILEALFLLLLVSLSINI